MAKPTSNPDWAQSADPADVDEPTAARAAGYQFEQDIAHDEINWQFKMLGEWLRWAEPELDVYRTAQEAVAETSEGDRVRVRNYEPGRFLLEERENWTLNDGVVALDTDCTNMAIGFASGDIEVRALSDPSTVVATMSKSGSGSVEKVMCWGEKVIAAYGNFIEMWDSSTGTSDWAYDHGATTNDVDVRLSIDLGGQYIIVAACDPDPANDYTAVGLNVTTGSPIWSFAHNPAGAATLRAVATDNFYAYVGGESGTSGENLYKLKLDDGSDEAVDFDFSTNVSDRSMAIDGVDLFVGSATTLAKVSRRSGQTLHSVGAPGIIIQDVDDEFLYLRGFNSDTSSYTLQMVNKQSFGVVAEHEVGNATSLAGCTDGYHVYVGSVDIGGTVDDLRRLNRGSREKAFMHVAINDIGIPFHRALIPSE